MMYVAIKGPDMKKKPTKCQKLCKNKWGMFPWDLDDACIYHIKWLNRRTVCHSLFLTKEFKNKYLEISVSADEHNSLQNTYFPVIHVCWSHKIKIVRCGNVCHWNKLSTRWWMKETKGQGSAWPSTISKTQTVK